MTADTIVHASTTFALVVLGIALLVTVYRVVIGPTLPDRVIALDMLVGIAIGFIAVIALRTGYTVYIDIAIALGLVGFLATVAFARFILARGKVGEGEGQAQASAARGKSDGPAKPAGARKVAGKPSGATTRKSAAAKAAKTPTTPKGAK
ncbi:cation:proton antiporter [Peteryoungia desertarenae]|uniref:Cation:proton antiporter n=1 Tax=Peteryoungia desertarenae TaxID=1813451 RepID=A0ABX6QNK8_9HYPH|nr:cation:proton antiporter [Peteryoungia desertarenae]QLF69810.1 cation:proton antiporter [Peteryoungia desertarenae]